MNRTGLSGFCILLLSVVNAWSASPDLDQVATSRGSFSSFLEIIAKGDAASQLDDGPVTVFIPTDAAFGRLSERQRQAIHAISPDQARHLAEHFIIRRKAMQSDNVPETIEAADGTFYDVTWYRGRLSIRDHRAPADGKIAYVSHGDIDAGQGVIDAIDTVLFPHWLRDETALVGMSSQDEGIPATTSPKPASVATAPATGQAPFATAGQVPSPSFEAPPAAPATSSSAKTEVYTVPITRTAPSRPVRSSSTGDVSSTLVLPPSGSKTEPLPTEQSTGPLSQTVASAPTGSAPVPSSDKMFASSVTHLVDAGDKPAASDVSVPASALRGWTVKFRSGHTGRVERVMIGVPSGRIVGIRTKFGGFLGIGEHHVFVPWELLKANVKSRTLYVSLTPQG